MQITLTMKTFLYKGMRPTVVDAARILGISPELLDTSFGVVPVNAYGNFAVLVREET